MRAQSCSNCALRVRSYNRRESKDVPVPLKYIQPAPGTIVLDRAMNVRAV